MLNNNIKKAFATSMVASMALAGVSFMPLFAQANNGLHLGLGADANAEVKVNNGYEEENSDMVNLKIQDPAFKAQVKAAQTTMRQSIKSANGDFKDAKKTAKVQLKTSVNAATNDTDRTAAIKAYFANVLAAFKIKAAAVQTAMQTFIDTHFNQTPTTNAQTVTLRQNTSANVALTGSDPEGSTLTYLIVSGTAHGTLSGTAPNLVYTPNANFTGSDSFTFKVNDGITTSSLTTVNIVVNP